jgi:tetratricopeptide (TPR) repeat protein
MVRTIYFSVIIIALGLCVWGCHPARPSEEISPIIEGEKAALLAQIEQKYENPAAHYRLGRLYHADGMYDKAEFEYRVALGFDPVNYMAQAGIVKALQDQGKTVAAASAAREYLNQVVDSAEAALLLGRAFESFELEQYALESYQSALILAPNSPEVYRRLGFYYLAEDDPVRAEENLRQSFQLDPYQPQVAEELGRMGVVVEAPQKPNGFFQKMFKKEEPETEE